MFSPIVTFDFGFIFRSFLTFWGPNGVFLGSGKAWETNLVSIYVVEQLSFSMIPLIHGYLDAA